MKNEPTTRIGIVGTGFISRGLFMALEGRPDLVVSKVLTRRDVQTCSEFPRQDVLTNSVSELIDGSGLVVECSGDPIHGTEVLSQVMAASLPVVTMDAELHVTTGSYFARRGFITEAEGDQPGCLAALREDAVQMGFRPLVYGNIKGFSNHNPTRDEMVFWAHKQGISLHQVTAATDGTKLQFEQALVANGLGADIVEPGMLGINCEDVNTGGNILADQAKNHNCAISDYLLSPRPPAKTLPKGVFITGEHDERQRAYLSYYKLGEGPYYTLLRSFYLPHLEIAKTIKRAINGGGVLLNNGENPTISIAAIAKRQLLPGEPIQRGVGSFEVRGIAVRIADHPDHIPIGLLANAVVARNIEPGQQISFDDVEIPESLALEAWRKTVTKPEGVVN